MLYVFLVDTGTMIQLEMNLALEKVSYLKGVIARSCRIPQEKQVLLISGGESLDPEERVCKYSAGTDTNPIFLFSMLNIESTYPPEVSSDVEFLEAELNEKVNASLMLEDAQSTVAIRATLAQEYVKASTDQTHVCERLIHDQHLQHQGWSAVVANLEDLASDLRRHAERLITAFNEYLQHRQRHLDVIDTFDDDLAVLHRIPVFPSLLNPEINPEMSMVGSFSADKEVSLLEWINAKGTSQSMQQVAESCYRSLQKLDQELLEELQAKVTSALEGSQNHQMKEIRGLGDRLAGLEQLLLEAKRLVIEQQELAVGFVHNQQRASGLRDISILPDLCASHRQQLIVMRKNHQSIISICGRSAKAKNELSANLHHRMKWVVFIQNQISEVGQLIVMHNEELKRLSRKLDAIEQIHLAPSIYLATAVEVVRRRAFAEQFLHKSYAIADTFSALHSEEFELRTNFHAKLKKHFLSKMFPGMEDLPPTFATERPEPFDDHLPAITLADVELLRAKFPDLAKSLSLPDENALSNLLAKSFNQTLTQEEGETLYTLQNLNKKINISNNARDIGSMSVMHQLMSGVMRKPTSSSSRIPSDTTDDSDEDRDTTRTRRFSNGKKFSKNNNKGSSSLLTKSLPHESMHRNVSTGFLVNDSSSTTTSADPSSSNNTTGTNSVAPSSSSGDGSVLKNSITASKVSLNQKVLESEAKLAKMQRSMATSATLTALKAELKELKEKLLQDQEAFKSFTHDMSGRIMQNVLRVNDNSTKSLSMAVEDIESRVRKESESDLEQVRAQLELELQKLEDCHREIDIYRQQLEQAAHEIDHLKTASIEASEEFDEQIKKLKEASDLEQAEIIKKLTLEHEIELDALREELENSEKVAHCEAEVQRLREVLQLKESDVEAFRRKTRLLEMHQDQRFQEEKEKIVAILESGFAQREKLSLTNLEAELRAKFDLELQNEKAKWEVKSLEALEELRQAQQSEFKEKLTELENAQKATIEAMVNKATEEMRLRFEADRELALRKQYQKLTMTSKNELDALRSRFKMMQTAGALERSPSCSESEMSIEQQTSPSSMSSLSTSVAAASNNGKRSFFFKSPTKSPKQDVIDSIRSAIKLEYENNLRAEQNKWEKQLQEIKEEHEQELVEMMSREKIRDIADQQVMFNEALNKAMDEKNHKLQDLTSKLAALEQELSLMKKSTKDTDLVQQLADLGQKNTRLEAELKEAKLKLDQAMCSSVMSVKSELDPDLQRLQKENAHLKEQLSKSMMALVTSGKVTVASVDRGDSVMVVWNEDHNNFSIYTEPGFNLPLHFLHNESISILGLSLPPNNGSKYATAEVVDKEYCQAKKSENRFKVPQGTKFYRVRCKPTLIKDNNKDLASIKSNGGSS